MARYKLERLKDQKNIFWKQRAKAHWLKDGDKNTSFFHACASEKRKVNLLKKLKANNGEVVEGDENLRSFIANYYQTSSPPVLVLVRLSCLLLFLWLSRLR
jgi:hypothetical protein